MEPSFSSQHPLLCSAIIAHINKSPGEYVFTTHMNNIILLKKCKNTVTNERYIPNITRTQSVIYRGNTFFVECIINKWDLSACNKCCERISPKGETLQFITGRMIHSSLFNLYDLDTTYSSGIYYCKCLEVAFYNDTIPHYYTGMWKSYHNNGMPRVIEYLVNGLKNGYHKYYHNNEQLSSEGYYNNDVKINTWKYYNEHGVQIIEKKTCSFENITL
jgi:hypothetical protein